MDNASKPTQSRPSLRLVTAEATDVVNVKIEFGIKKEEVITETDAVGTEVTSTESTKPELKSALARRLTAFADDLDKQIALLLAQ